MIKYNYCVCDFETTVNENRDEQKETEVWASAIVPLEGADGNQLNIPNILNQAIRIDNVVILHSIERTFQLFEEVEGNVCGYYHNLKFDGAFWIDYLMRNGFKYGDDYIGNDEEGFPIYKRRKDSDLKQNTFTCTISSKGQWYSILIRTKTKYILLQDSLKLLPFSVKKIGKDFKTEHQKLEMKYTGNRWAGCKITDEEARYIANDVLVVKEALEIMFKEGHKKLTIGSCCLSEFKKDFEYREYKYLFPDLTEIQIDESIYSAKNADAYIRKSYKGGWCYLVKGKEDQVKRNGVTADVNSLYPSMMHSESKNRYPIGKPIFWRGDIPLAATGKYTYFFVRLKTRFYIKEGKLPFIQIKGSPWYNRNECLESSDTKVKGHEKERVELTLTGVDYYLFLEHYNTEELEILDGCYFETEIGLFDHYINHYKKIKQESKGAIRQIAKLFLNNLYGKFASSTDSSFKVPVYLPEKDIIGYVDCHANDKKAGYIAIGSAITSYARRFTITAAQLNYHGKTAPGFIYADTDSIHCDLKPDEVKGITVHPTAFCCWKLESSWDTAIFNRQKTYIEHVIAEDLEPIEKPFYSVRCAGMPDNCKNQFIEGLKKNEKQLTDFAKGLKIEGKLMPKRIKGGVLLVETTFEIK